MSKLERVEKDCIIVEVKMKLWKMFIIGLVWLVFFKYDFFIIYCGEGVFCDKDFKKRSVGKEYLGEMIKESGFE